MPCNQIKLEEGRSRRSKRVQVSLVLMAAAAYGALSDFLNEVHAQAGKKLSEAQAQQLTAAANDIRAQLGC